MLMKYIWCIHVAVSAYNLMWLQLKSSCLIYVVFVIGFGLVEFEGIIGPWRRNAHS